ncbi:MAG TPA: hypothetical protein VG318_00515 [Actinomycetota bacterium]|nr:hypothetical protein [Actinomycetota bacterium]
MTEGFSADGEVRLQGVVLGGDLACSGGVFKNPGNAALSADGLVASAVFLDGIFAEGEVGLLNCTVGAQMSCRRGVISNPDGDALSLDGAAVDGSLLLDQSDIGGAVRLHGATIAGQLACRGSTFRGSQEGSLIAKQAVVKGDVFLDGGFRATGNVDFRGASIAGSFETVQGSFEGDEALRCERMQVTGQLKWSPATAPKGRVDLGDARCGELVDDLDSWPERPEHLNLDGLVYETLGPDDDLRRRLGWLATYCSGTRYRPQPYEQVAGVYRREGRDSDARTVLVAREHARRKSLRRTLRPLHWLFGALVGYGHRLSRPIAPLIVLIAVASFQFAEAHRGCDESYSAKSCSMTVTSESVSSSEFHPVVYAVDTALPIIDLHQQGLWIPRDSYRWWFWILISTGWLLTTAVVAGLTRVLGRS